MRRLLQILIPGLIGLSLLLCIASLVFWVRSYWVRDLVSFGHQGGNCHIAQSILGRVHLLSNLDGGCSGGSSYNADRLSPQAIWNGGMSSYPITVNWRFGFVWQTYERHHFGFSSVSAVTTHHRLIVLPWWFPAAVFALLPSAWLVRWLRGARRRRWAKTGCCLKCGYDLRGTPKRCPECGTAVEKRA